MSKLLLNLNKSSPWKYSTNLSVDITPVKYYTFMALVVGRYEGLSTRRIWLLRLNKASYLPTTTAINCLLYRNYTHNKTFF